MLLKLCFNSLRYDLLLNFCLGAALCAVITPLLMLFSLRYGIITSLEDNLKSNPEKLEIKLKSETIPADVFDRIKSNDGVSFVMPMTRTPSATADIRSKKLLKQRIDTLPSGKGDPVVLKSSLEDSLDSTQAYISENLAYEMGLKAGDQLQLLVSRKIDGRSELARVSLSLKGIIKKEYLYNKLLINFDTYIKMEDYRDGFDPDIFSTGLNPKDVRDHFNGARIYVKTIDDIEKVHNFITDLGYTIASDSTKTVKENHAIETVLTFIFVTIAAASAVGGVCSVTGLGFTNFARRKKSFALLRLTGLSKSDLMRLMVMETFILSSLSYLFSALLMLFFMNVLNGLFHDTLNSDSIASSLTLFHYLTGYVTVTLTCILISAAICVLKVFKIDEASTLREI